MNNASPIEAAVQFLYDAVKKQVLSEVTEALGGPWETAPKTLHYVDGRSAAAPNGKAPRSHLTGARKKGEKRSPHEIEATVRELLAQIKDGPGRRIEELGAALGMKTKDLALPAKKLLGEKKIRTKGQKRATRYWAR